jgi:hypothetical protein
LPKIVANVKCDDGIAASSPQAKAAALPKRPSPKFAGSSSRKCLRFKTLFQAILKELGKDVQFRFS